MIKFFKLTIVYIIMFIFLFAPLSYSKNKTCVVKQGSSITTTLHNMTLFIFLSSIKEYDLVSYMLKKKRIAAVKQDLKVIVIDVIKDTEDGLDIAKVKLKNNPKIVFYVLYYNVVCDKKEHNPKKPAFKV